MWCRWPVTPVVFVTTLLVACTSDSGSNPTQPTSPVATTIDLSTTSVSLASPGADQQLSATVLVPHGDAMTSASVTWSSANPSIAAVTSSGLVTGVAQGSTSVTAALGTLTADATVTVGPLPSIAAEEFCSDQPGDAIAAFMDAGLEAVVRDSLAIGPDDDLLCSALETITGLATQFSDGVESLVGIQNLSGLRELAIAGSYVSDLGPLSTLTGVVVLDLDQSDYFSDLSPLVSMTGLRELYLGNTDGITDLTQVAALTNLTVLNFQEHFSNSDIGPLSALTNLEYLELSANDISDLSALSGLTSLTYLGIGDNTLTDLSALAGLTRLEYLGISSNNTLSDLGPLASLTSLRSLDASSNMVSDLTPLATLTSLESLDLWGNDILADLTPLSGLTSLTDLNLTKNAITDISPLAALTALTILHVQNNDVVDVGPLAGLTALETLNLRSNRITDLTALGGLVNLSELYLSSNSSLSNVQPLIENDGLGEGDEIELDATQVSCDDVAVLQARGATVSSRCG